MRATSRTLFFTLIGVAFFSLSFQSCDETPDKDVAKGDIPADFNYVTIKSFDLQINVNDKYDGKHLYKVEVFDQNPLTSDTVVNLLAAGVANMNKAFVTRVVIPQYVTTLFVRQTDPVNKSVVKAVKVDETVTTRSLVCNFKPVVGSQPAKMQKAAPSNNEKASDYVLPSGTTSISSNAPLMGAKYLVPTGVSITNLDFGWLTGSELYVQGTLLFNKNSNVYVPGNTKIVLLPGASVTFTKQNEMNFEQAGTIIAVHEGATLTFEENAAIGNGTKLINDGIVNCARVFQVRTSGLLVNNNDITTTTLDITNSGIVINHDYLHMTNNVIMNSSANMVNNGLIEADVAFTSNNQTVKIYNNHIIKTPFFDFARGGGELFNACRIECEDFLAEGSIVHNSEGALIVCQDFQSNNTTFNLTGGSMIQVKDLGYDNIDEVKDSGLTFKNNIIINGTAVAGVQPLFSTWKIENKTNGSKVVSLKGEFEFSVTNGSIPPAKYFLLIEPDVTLTTTPVTSIASSSCNLGGVNNSGGGGGDDDDDDDGTGGGGDTGGGGGGPTDPTFPIVVVEGTDYIYSMEDLWPYMGDYDMNDFVFKIHAITKYVNSSNRIEKMTFELTPLASGSTMKLSAALQLDAVAAGLTNIVSTGSIARPDNGHTQANFILFENVHSLFGLSDHSIVNTFNAQPKIETSTYTFEISFSTPVEQNQVSVDKLNFYSIVGEINSNDRHEIHLAGYAPSSKVSKPTGSYKDENNMVWALMLPTSSYKYPAENVKIFDAYPNFMNWARSGGKEFTDWFLNPVDSAELIYLQ